MLSICIPTYNRADSLADCLNSIYLSSKTSNLQFEVCVSNNGSSDQTSVVIDFFNDKLPIKYFSFDSNQGRVRNYLNVVEMASGDFVWLLGDDDLLTPYAFEHLDSLLINNKDVDFFYVNSFNLSSNYLKSFERPFDTRHLPEKMTTFSTFEHSKQLRFLDLVNPNISFDFVGAMFLAVFRRSMWSENVNHLNFHVIDDDRVFSHFDNTFPHLKIFINAFSKSNSYFYSTALSVNLSGEREWSPMSPLINIVRLVEALDLYKSQGLPLFQYLRCKNFALRTFWPDFLRMLIRRKESGFEYVNTPKLLFSSILYPNAWFSPFRYLYDLLRRIIKL